MVRQSRPHPISNFSLISLPHTADLRCWTRMYLVRSPWTMSLAQTTLLLVLITKLLWDSNPIFLPCLPEPVESSNQIQATTMTRSLARPSLACYLNTPVSKPYHARGLLTCRTIKLYCIEWDEDLG
jgi:hypothetical protein